MKREIRIIFVAVSAAMLLSGCNNKYKESLAIPEDYPEELKIYNDAIVYEVVEEDKEIKIVYGTKDNLEDVAEFYGELMDGMKAASLDENQSSVNYTVDGWGVYYDFDIKASAPAEKEVQRHFETIVTVKVEVDEGRTELMENLQGYWAYVGNEQGYQYHYNRYGIYYHIDKGEFMRFENCAPKYSEAHVFFADEEIIIVKSEHEILQEESCKVIVQKVNGVATMVTMNEYDTRVFEKVDDDELEDYMKINEMWQMMQGFWCSVGADGEMGEEYKGYGYDFTDLKLTAYYNGEVSMDSVDYYFVDAQTILLDFGDDQKSGLGVSFELDADGNDIMNLQYANEIVHLKRSTSDEYLGVMFNGN